MWPVGVLLEVLQSRCFYRPRLFTLVLGLAYVLFPSAGLSQNCCYTGSSLQGGAFSAQVLKVPYHCDLDWTAELRVTNLPVAVIHCESQTAAISFATRSGVCRCPDFECFEDPHTASTLDMNISQSQWDADGASVENSYSTTCTGTGFRDVLDVFSGAASSGGENHFMFRASEVQYACENTINALRLETGVLNLSVVSDFAFTWEAGVVTTYVEERTYRESGTTYKITVSDIAYVGQSPDSYEMSVENLVACTTSVELTAWALVKSLFR